MFVNLWTIGRFLFGSASAIKEVARNGAALWTGIALVLLTGIARNYDQSYFLATPMWLIGPLAFSFFSGSFLYGVLIRGLARQHLPEERRNESQWTTFMAVFWMTAPVAWLYAIPVERFLDSYQAAQANIALLGIVSLWRVLLMSRILAVLVEIPFLRAAGWVLIAASLEVITVLFLGLFFSGEFSRRILAGMAGMRNAPEETLLSAVLGNVWVGAWVVLFVSAVALALHPFEGSIRPLPKAAGGKAPWFSLLALSLLWTGIAIRPQKEQRRFVTHAALVEKADYQDALEYLAQHAPSDFPPGRRLEPNPYEYRVWRDLPPTIAQLTPETATWIRQLYLRHLAATLSHRYSGYHSLTNVAPMLSALERLPESKEWLSTNQVALARVGLGLRHGSSESVDTAELIARTNILSALSRMGMAPTNLARLVE